MRRLVLFIVIMVAVLGFAAGAASAHVLVVDPPGQGEPPGGWVGSPSEGIPGQGQGLILGGPEGTTTLSPSHGGGLVTACEAVRGNGRAAADIFGPPTPAGCPHGT